MQHDEDAVRPDSAEPAEAAAAAEAGEQPADPGEIRISDTGPIRSCNILTAPEGGVVVLRGRNGTGKTTALRATEALLQGRGTGLQVRDRAIGGSVEGLGVTIRVSSRTRASGELVVEGLEAPGMVSELVAPAGIKGDTESSRAAADERRIKALVRMLRITLEPADFYSAVGGKERFDELVERADLIDEDPVVAAAKVKRECQHRAKALEHEADAHLARAAGIEESVEDLGEGETDEGKLAAALEEAVRYESDLRAQRRHADQDRERRAEARARLTELDAEEAPSRERLEQAVSDAKDQVVVQAQRLENASERVRDARVALENAEAQERGAREDHAAAQREVEAARKALAGHDQASAQVEELRQRIEGEPLPGPDEDALGRAERAVVAAREAMERGALLRRAQAKRREAAGVRERAEQVAKTAEQWRARASNVDTALSDALNAQTETGLYVVGDRLVTDTARGQTFWADLSEGERWRKAIDLGLAAVGERAVLVVSQEAWEALDPINRTMVDRHAREKRVTILTAEATEGALRAEAFAEAVS